MARRRDLLALVPLLSPWAIAGRAGAATLDPARVRPAIISAGQSQAGQGGTSPARTGPRDTDTAARMPQHLLMFRTVGDENGSSLEGAVRVRGGKRRVLRFAPERYTGFAPYRDKPGESVNAATPFLFALADRLRARGLIPNGLFGFTCWQGATPLNAFLPPDDPDYANTRAGDYDGDGQTDRASNYENIIAAVVRYATFTRADGLVPHVPMIRFEHGEGRISPRSRTNDLEAETARYVAAHIRMSDRLARDVRDITGQADPPIFLLGGWGGRDSTVDFDIISHETSRRLVDLRPDRYVGPASVPYMGPLYNDAGAASQSHPSFLGRVMIGEAQAHVADLCLDQALRPNPTLFRPLRCIGLQRLGGSPERFELRYHAPPAAVGSLAFATDDWLPATENHGFEYLGREGDAVGVAGVEIVPPDRVRVTLRGDRTDPGGEILYGYLPRANRLADGLWNYRGNLVWPTDVPSYYAPILAAPPYELGMPPRLRYVAMWQRLRLGG